MTSVWEKERKNIFTEFVVVFTDYTEESTKIVEEKRREKDPILFGIFYEKSGNNFSSRKNLYDKFYYIGDWVDEHCDLTLSKLVEETAKKTGKDIKHKIMLPKDEEEIKNYIAGLKKDEETHSWHHNPEVTKKKKSFFKRVKSFLGK